MLPFDRQRSSDVEQRMYAQAIRANLPYEVKCLCMKHPSRETTPHVEPRLADDPALMTQLALGQEAALSELYDRYGRLVFSVAYRVVRNQETAEEVTLDIFTRAWEKAHTYDPQLAKVSTWLTRMARNLAIDRLRREQVRPSQHSISWGEVKTEPRMDGSHPETAVQLNMEQQRVRTAIASLPPNQREALALAFFEGYSHSEIAFALNKPLGTVKGRIRAAMQKLRTLLADEQQVKSGNL